MDPLIAVYDACVLYSNFLRDFLVRLAIQGRKTGVLRAKWTGRIHREWMRAVLRRRSGLARAALLRTRQLMDENDSLGARVQGYQRWERRLTLPDPDDRHVLAAAVACAADVIVTFNTSDFPSITLNPFCMQAATPDAFVYQLEPSGIVVRAAREHRASLARPALSPAEYLDYLRRNGLPATAAWLPPNFI